MDGRGTVGQRIAAVGRRRKQVVVHLHQLGGVFGDVSILGDDHGDGFAHINDLVSGQHRTVAVLLVTRAGKTDDEKFRQQMGPQVVEGQYRVDTGKFQGGGGVDAADLGMGVGASNEGGLEHGGDGNVVDKPRLATQQFRILDPLDTNSQHGPAHGLSPPSGPAVLSCPLSRWAASSAASTMPW